MKIILDIHNRFYLTEQIVHYPLSSPLGSIPVRTFANGEDMAPVAGTSQEKSGLN